MNERLNRLNTPISRKVFLLGAGLFTSAELVAWGSGHLLQAVSKEEGKKKDSATLGYLEQDPSNAWRILATGAGTVVAAFCLRNLNELKGELKKLKKNHKDKQTQNQIIPQDSIIDIRD